MEDEIWYIRDGRWKLGFSNEAIMISTILTRDRVERSHSHDQLGNRLVCLLPSSTRFDQPISDIYRNDQIPSNFCPDPEDHRHQSCLPHVSDGAT